MTSISLFLADKGIYFLTLLLMAIGVAGIIVCGNYMKKLICMNIMQVAVIFFFLCFGHKDGATLPIITEGLSAAADYLNPLPHGLMLTAIVVSLGTTGVGLSFLFRMFQSFGSIEEEDIIEGEKRED